MSIGTLGSDIVLKNEIIFLPSAFNFLILKLCAFDDRKEEESDFGQYHAWDIFMTIVRMNKADWDSAKKHLDVHSTRPYIEKAVEIRKNNFSDLTNLGLLRLREYPAYKREKERYDQYLSLFIKDLSDLFPSTK